MAHIFSLSFDLLLDDPPGPPQKNRSTDPTDPSQELLRELLSDTDSDSQPHQVSEGVVGNGGEL